MAPATLIARPRRVRQLCSILPFMRAGRLGGSGPLRTEIGQSAVAAIIRAGSTICQIRSTIGSTNISFVLLRFPLDKSSLAAIMGMSADGNKETRQ